jgi:replicative DNA helicase
MSEFDFNAKVQTQIASLMIRDVDFMRRVDSLVLPEHFENLVEKIIVDICCKHYHKYYSLPNIPILLSLIKDRLDKKIIKADLIDPIKSKIKEIFNETDISQKDFLLEKTNLFVRKQNIQLALEQAIDSLQKNDLDAIEKNMLSVFSTQINNSFPVYDYFGEIENRTQERRDILAGKVAPIGITTGVPALDAELEHKGWGRKELSLIMGAAKSGKTMGLGDFAKLAATSGSNVLYFTLEVSAEVLANRLDSNISDIKTREIGKFVNLSLVENAVKVTDSKSGRLHIQVFPTGKMKISDLRRVFLNQQASLGINYDLIVVDYADLMAPEIRNQDRRNDFEDIYKDLRAFAQVYNVAMLTATQTNREGAKSALAKATDVSEDFNKIRLADLVLSINVTQEEREMGQARLYFAASRNQESDFTLLLNQDLSKAQFIKSVVGRV